MRIKPIRMEGACVLDATPLKYGSFRIWLPGGETFVTGIPRDGTVDRLPRQIHWKRRVAIAYGFARPGGELRVMAYDVESVTRGASPNPDRDLLKSIAWWGDRSAYAYDCEDDADREEAIAAFCAAVRWEDPDVVATYFGNRYDTLLMLKEAHRLGMALGLGRAREDEDPAEPEPEYGRDRSRWGVRRIGVEGRLHFDVFDEAVADQSLIGVRKGLKDIAAHFGLPHVVVEDAAAIAKARVDKRLWYNLSDARLTWLLARTYLINMVELAERLEAPLTLIAERRSTHIGDFFYGRDFLQKDEPYAGNNAERFPWVFDKPGKKYQGAYCELLRTGLFEPAWKVDFNSLYPSVMAMLNLDAETVRLVSRDPKLFEGIGEMDPVFGPGTVTVFDDKLGSMTFEVCAKPDSVTRIEMTKLLKWKKELKPESKKNAIARSKYWVVKLLLNETYGYHGTPWSNWGYAPVSFITTAGGRLLMRGLRDEVGAFGVGIDTDGEIGFGPVPDVHAIEEKLRLLIPEEYDRLLIELDVDYFEGILSVDEKNYITKEKGKLLFHGSGLKGRHIPRAVSNCLDAAVAAVFDKSDWKDALKIAVSEIWSLPVGQFSLSADFGKDPSTYPKTNLYGNLSKQLIAAGIEVAEGDSVRYVKAKHDYVPDVLLKGAPLDKAYYEKRIADIVARALGPVEPELTWKKVMEVIK